MIARSRIVVPGLWLMAFLSAIAIWVLAPTPEPVDRGGCSPLAEVPGPEDFTVDLNHSRLLVSSQNRRAVRDRGAIYSVSLDQATNGLARKLTLSGRGNCSFHPHGIYLQRGDDRAPTISSDILFVINHHDAEDLSTDRSCFPDHEGSGADATSIEVFEVHDNHLRLLRRLAAPTILTGGNDLVVTRDGDVFVTVPPRSVFKQAGEAIFGHVESKVVQFRCEEPSPDGTCEGVWLNLKSFGRMVNGIVLGKTTGNDTAPFLVVASAAGNSLYRIALDGPGEVEEVEARTGHDNLNWLGDTDRLLAATHTDLRRYIQHAVSPGSPSPSEVWVYDPEEKGDYVGTRIFVDDGSTLSGVSNAICWQDRLILGQVFGDAVLSCTPATPLFCPRGPAVSGGTS